MAIRKTMIDKNGNKKYSRQICKEKGIAMIIGGLSITEAAKKCKVRREMVYKWLEEPAVVLELESCFGIMRFEAMMQTKSLIDTSLDAIEVQIREGDGRLGLDFLKHIGALKTAGNSLGLEVENDEGNGVTITINTNGHGLAEAVGQDDNAPAVHNVIDAEIVQDLPAT